MSKFSLCIILLLVGCSYQQENRGEIVFYKGVVTKITSKSHWSNKHTWYTNTIELKTQTITRTFNVESKYIPLEIKIGSKITIYIDRSGDYQVL